VSLDLVQEFDFDTPGDYTLVGLEIASGTLQTPDGFLMLPASVKKWDEVLDQVLSGDHEGDLKPVTDTLHVALDGESSAQPLEWEDYIFSCWLFHQQRGFQTKNKHLGLYSRYYNSLGGDEYIESRLFQPDQASVTYRHYMADTSLVINDAYMEDDFPIEVWRHVTILALGNMVRFTLGAQRDYAIRHHDRTDQGAPAFYCTDPVNSWYIGGDDGTPGHPSAKPCPFACRRKFGSCELNEDAAWTAPDDITGLNSMTWNTELAWLPTHEDAASAPYFSRMPDSFQYNHYNGSSWTGWLDLPEHGDMSGVAVSAGDKLRWRFNDGSGHGLDNGEDPRWQPQVKRVLLSYTVDNELATDSPTAHRRSAVKAGPRRGAFD